MLQLLWPRRILPPHRASKRGRLFEGTLPTPEPIRRGETPRGSRFELLLRLGGEGGSVMYVGRATGTTGFSRLVAIKRPCEDLAGDSRIQRMIATEAKLASQLHHGNVVAVQDVEQLGEDLLLVLDYVEGASLADLLEAAALSGADIPVAVAVRIVLDACSGLSAAHEFERADGHLMGFLHRNLSPQNILVGLDGTARITDFGLAKSRTEGQTGVTRTLKGKLAYMAPEVLDDARYSVQSDVFAMGVVAWETLTRQRLYRGESWADTVRKIGRVEPPLPSKVMPSLGPAFDEVILRALDRSPKRRFATVREFEEELERVAIRGRHFATATDVSRVVRTLAGDALQRRRELLRSIVGEQAGSDVMVTSAPGKGQPPRDDAEPTTEDLPTRTRPAKKPLVVVSARARALPPPAAGSVPVFADDPGDEEATVLDTARAAGMKRAGLKPGQASGAALERTAAAAPAAVSWPAGAAGVPSSDEEETKLDMARIAAKRARGNDVAAAARAVVPVADAPDDETGVLKPAQALSTVMPGSAGDRERGGSPSGSPLDKALRLYSPAETPRIYYPEEARWDVAPAEPESPEEEPATNPRDAETPTLGKVARNRSPDGPGASEAKESGVAAPLAAPAPRTGAGLPVGASARESTPATLRRKPRMSRAATARKIAGLVAFSAAEAAVVLAALILASPPPPPKRAVNPSATPARTALQAR